MKTLSTLTDETLVRLYGNGEDSAFETLLMRHKNSVYSYIYSFIKEESVTDDIFQETFIKVINCIRRGDYIESGKFKYWVIRIARNLVIDHIRLKKASNTMSAEDESAPLDNLKLCDSNIEDLLITEQINADIQSLIALLPPLQRETVILRFYEDLSFKEIAELTGVSINTSLGRMRYALINLRKIIRERNLNLEA